MISLYLNLYRTVNNHVIFTYGFCFCMDYNNVSFLVKSYQLLFENKLSWIKKSQILGFLIIYVSLSVLKISSKSETWSPEPVTFIYIMASKFNIVITVFKTCRRKISILNTEYYESPFEK